MNNIYVVAVQSQYVGATTLTYTQRGEEKVREYGEQEYSLMIGATPADTLNDAIVKMANNHDLPADILTGYQVS